MKQIKKTLQLKTNFARNRLRGGASQTYFIQLTHKRPANLQCMFCKNGADLYLTARKSSPFSRLVLLIRFASVFFLQQHSTIAQLE